MDELRRKGLAKMNEVYGWEMPNIEGNPYFDLTVDHLFGTIWTRPGLSMRDKRIMTLTAVASWASTTSPRSGPMRRCTTRNFRRRTQGDGDLPHAPRLPVGLEIRRRGRAGRREAGRRPPRDGSGRGQEGLNVNAAVKMHSGKTLDD